MPEDEAPAAIFQTELGSSDVSMFLTGYWNIALSGSVGFARSPQYNILTPFSFPGMTHGVIFEQEPDLFISLWLNKKYFFEASVIAGYELNTLLLGYDGFEDEFVRRVRIGNTDVNMSNYSLLSLSDPPSDSIGASALFASERSRQEILLRLDRIENKKKVFIGNNEIIETEIHLQSYLRGKLLILPDDTVDDLEILIETTPGDGSIALTDIDGRTYSRPAAGQVFASADKGVVILKQETDARIIAYYRKNGNPVGHSTIGKSALSGETANYIDIDAPLVDFSFSSQLYFGVQMDSWKIDGGDKDYLLLYDKGAFSPFEHMGVYQAGSFLPEENWRSRIIFDSNEEIESEINQDGQFFTLYRISDDIRAPSNRYPFAMEFPHLYGPSREINIGYTDRFLIHQTLYPVELFQLEDALEGSIRITRNYEPEMRFEIEPSGIVKFFSPVLPDDRLEISYKTSSQQSKGGDLLFGYGADFQILPNLVMSTAIGLNWNVFAGSFSTKVDDNPGSILAGIGADFKTDLVSVDVDGGLTVSSPDTSGVFRLFGMEDHSINIPIADTQLAPARPPDTPPGMQVLSISNRGKLLYKDYRTYAVSGTSYLNRYDWTEIPANQIFSYTDGSIPGPYIASSGDNTVGDSVMVLDYVLADEDDWIGAQFPFFPNHSSPDLSTFDSLQFFWKAEGDINDLQIYIQIGAIGEDIDNDGLLDSESTELSQGFTFDDPSNDVYLLIGGGSFGLGNNTTDSEDKNANGVLDREVTRHIVTREINSADIGTFPSADWQSVEIEFTEVERHMLSDARAIRFIIEKDELAEKRGRLLIGGLQINGSEFKAYSQNSGSVIAQEIDEQLHYPEDLNLETTYTEVQRIFHPAGEDQRILEIAWNAISPDEGWHLTGLTSTVLSNSYGELNFFMKPSALTPDEKATLQIDLTDNMEKGYHFEFPITEQDRWTRWNLDLRNGKVYADGALVNGTNFTVDNDIRHINKFHMKLSGTTDGVLLLDEIHLSDASISVGIGAAAVIEITPKGKGLSVFGIPILTNITIREEVSVRSEAYNAGVTSTAVANGISSSTEFDAVSLYTGIHTEFNVNWIADLLLLSGGHRFTFPSFQSPLSFTDAFNLRRFADGFSFSHSNRINAALPNISELILSATSSTYEETLNQSWNAELRSRWTAPVSYSVLWRFLNVSSEYRPSLSGYFHEWAESFKLLVPRMDSDRSEREMSAQMNLTYELPSISVFFSPLFSYRNWGSGTRQQQNKGEIQLKIPLIFNEGTLNRFSFNTTLKRSFSHSLQSVISNGVNDDISIFWSNVSTQKYLLSIPLLDIFTSDLTTQFSNRTQALQRAEYIPSVQFDFSRSFGSSIWDLLFPSAVGFGLTRELLREEDSISNLHTAKLQLRFAAINLFGQTGAYRLTSLYETEEISGNLTFFAGTSDMSALETWDLILQNYFAFYGEGDNELSFDNWFSVSSNSLINIVDEATVAYTWYKDIERIIRIPLVNIEVEKGVYYQNKESLSVSYNQDNEHLNIRARHATTLFVGSYGHIEGNVGFGIDSSSPSGDQNRPTWLFGLEAGIQARVTF